MAAGLETLRDDRVASLGLEPSCLVHRSRRRQDLRARRLDASHQIPVRESEVEADDLGPEVDHEITHAAVEWRAAGGRGRCPWVESELDVITFQTPPPGSLAVRVSPRWPMAEEVDIDRP